VIRVTIEMESAVNGKSWILGRIYIWNRGGGGSDPKRSDYGVAVCKKGEYDVPFGTVPSKTTRTGEVLNYPRLSYNVWRLIARALKSAFPEER
jgi:hypothetical protein